jgi:pimeloyl-ACP methyl ester carboxylesterase
MKAVKLNRRAFQLAALGLLASSGTALAARPIPAPAGAKPKTFVLVHGAWYGGWCWDAVAQALRAQGHQVTTPTCPGLGEQAHLLSKEITLSTFITSISEHLRYENLSEVILVGSGFAGVVISGVADRAAGALKRLVYVDAMVLDSGQSVFEAQPAGITQKRLEQAEREGKGVAIPAPPASTYGVTDARTMAWLSERLSPQPLGTYQEKLVLNNPLGNGVARLYVDCTASPFAPLVEVKTRLRRQAGWTWAELNSHHDPMITEPQMLADLLAGL